MYEYQNENTIEHFNWGHFAAIAVCALFLVSITVMRNGFSFSAHAEQKQYTLADAVNDVAQKTGASFSPKDDPGYAEASQKLAEINPTQDSGQVLGASTEFEQGIQTASQLLTPENLSQIKIETVSQYDDGFIQRYVDYLNNAEMTGGKDIVFANLNSTDKTSVDQASVLAAQIVANISTMKVPVPFEKFHKLKILYYATLINIMQTRAGNISSEGLSDSATTLFGILDQLGTEQAQLSSKYNVEIGI